MFLLTEWCYSIHSLECVITALHTVLTGRPLPSPQVVIHRQLGITTLTLALLQATALFLRPKTGTPVRPYWSFGHRWVGRGCAGTAIGNIFLGESQGQAADDATGCCKRPLKEHARMRCVTDHRPPVSSSRACAS